MPSLPLPPPFPQWDPGSTWNPLKGKVRAGRNAWFLSPQPSPVASEVPRPLPSYSSCCLSVLSSYSAPVQALPARLLGPPRTHCCHTSYFTLNVAEAAFFCHFFLPFQDAHCFAPFRAPGTQCWESHGLLRTTRD
jgi:hypothetical protein